MKKLVSLILALMLTASLSAFASAEEGTVYGTATLTYAEFYSGDVSSTNTIDAVTSATTSKSGTFKNTVSDFVDEQTNKDGYHLTASAEMREAALFGENMVLRRRIDARDGVCFIWSAVASGRPYEMFSAIVR